jgi:hypothetical protein
VRRTILVVVLIRRAIAIGAGAFTFWAAHIVEVAHWHDWFRGAYDPWFLNSGRAVVFTLASVAFVSAAVGAFDRRPRATKGLTLAGGAFAAMVLVLFLRAAGPGTIFPIVIVAGGVLLVVSSVAGAWAGTLLGRVAVDRR